MTGRIGWYVHHHGRGHLTRMTAIARHLDAEIDCFSTLPRPEGLPAHCTWTELARDDDARPGAPADPDPTAGGLLHWAPLGHPGHRARLATLAASLDARPVDAFVVDVSAEVTLFVRLLGIPTVILTQPGERIDEPHRLAFAAATRIIAPWPAPLSSPPHLAALGDRVAYVGGISRFADRMPAPADRGEDVVLLGGGGGATLSGEDLATAERATGRRWRVLGANGATWQEDPWADLTTASVVVSWCGQNAIADLAAAEARAVVIAQPRPFDEQRATARTLRDAGLAVALDAWPSAERWPALLAEAGALHPRWELWEVAGAAERAAAAITATARGSR